MSKELVNITTIVPRVHGHIIAWEITFISLVYGYIELLLYCLQVGQIILYNYQMRIEVLTR